MVSKKRSTVSARTLKTKAHYPKKRTTRQPRKRATKMNFEQMLEEMESNEAPTEKVWVDGQIVEVPVKRKPKKSWSWGKIFLGAATATALAGLGIYGILLRLLRNG